MSSDYSVLATLFAAFAAFAVIFVIVALIEYIFSAIAMYSMAKKRGITHPWLAWIPLANCYLFGELLFDKVHFGKLVIPAAKWVLLIAPIVLGILGSFINSSIILGILGVFYLVYSFAAYFRLFKLYAPDKAVLFLILSIFFSILAPIFMFAIRKGEAKEYLVEEAPAKA